MVHTMQAVLLNVAEDAAMHIVTASDIKTKQSACVASKHTPERCPVNILRLESVVAYAAGAAVDAAVQLWQDKGQAQNGEQHSARSRVNSRSSTAGCTVRAGCQTGLLPWC